MDSARRAQVVRCLIEGNSINSAHACQADRRIKACLNQDGENGMKPFYLDARGEGMYQPFMFIERAPRTSAPTDQELAEMKITQTRLNEVLSQLRAYKGRALRSTGTTYHVILRNDVTTHMDFTDLPILAAKNVTEARTRMEVMAVVTAYTRAFFDRYLTRGKAVLLDGKEANQFVEAVEKIGPRTGGHTPGQKPIRQ